MRGVYSANIRIAALNSSRTLLYITVSSNKIVELIASSFTNSSNGTNQQLEVAWQKVNALGTPTATTLTPSKHEQGDQAAASTVKGNVTLNEPTYVADTEIGRKGIASLQGYEFPLRDEERLIMAGGDTWGLRLLNPSSPTAFDGIVNVTFLEKG